MIFFRPSGYGFLLCGLLFCSQLGYSASDLPFDSKLEGPQNAYTDFIVQLLKNWTQRKEDSGSPFDLQTAQPVQVRCLSLPEGPYYIGIEQRMSVDASFETVAGILDDYSHYGELFPGFEKVSVVSSQGNKAVLSWEQIVPVIFVSNIHYDLIYLTYSPSPTRKAYRYKLLKSDNLTESDGVIVIEKQGPQSVRYREWDFWNADWGSLKTFAPSRIWSDSLKGVLLSDLSLKLKAEKPADDYRTIHKAADKIVDNFPIDAVLKAKQPFDKKLYLP